MRMLIRILATGLGSGYFPYLPGTTGTAAAAVIAYFYKLQLWQIFIICLVGVFICQEGEKIFRQHDSPQIVFDEFCGLFIATWQVETPALFFAAFLLFRFLDMVKPFPIKQLQELPGGWGVMADDIAAGLIARALLVLFPTIL